MKTISISIMLSIAMLVASCSGGGKSGALGSSAAEKVYVQPGEHDDYYAFISG